MKPRVKINRQCCWNILFSQQMLGAIKHVVDDNFVFQRDTAPMHLTLTQCNCCSAKLSTSFLLSYNSPELNSTDCQMQGVIYQHEHESQVTRVNKLSQQLVEVWQCI